MRRPRTLNIHFVLLILTLLSACSDHADELLPMSGKEISLYSRATVGDAAQSARLLFWLKSDYEAFYDANNNYTRSPYDWIDMPQYIDTYKLSDTGEGTPFNTFKPYPTPEDKEVYASGFAPSNAYDKNFSHGYYEIDILDEKQDGLTDFLASNNDGKSRGSCESPFRKDKTDELTDTVRQAIIAYNLERELKFRHLTACISFKAQRDSNMYNKIGVRDVMVEIVNDNAKKLAVPKSIVAYQSPNPDSLKWTYIIGKEDSTRQTFSKKVSGDVMMNENKQLAEFYLNTANIKYGENDGQFDPFIDSNKRKPDTIAQPTLKVNISATFFMIQDPTQHWNISWEGLTVTSWDLAKGAVATGKRFLPGYKYEVTINFNNTAIGLKAVQLPWKPGGTYYYQVWGETGGSESL